MANKLSNMKITEVAFCKKGMNQHARITLFKSADAEKETKMPTEKTADEKMVDLTKALETANAAIEANKAELAKANAIAALSDAEKTAMEKMTDVEKADWLNMKPEDRKKKVDDVKKSDETITVDGAVISKSVVGDATFALYKRVAANEVEVAKAKDEAITAKFEKRASEEFKNLPGTDVEKAKLLKFIATGDKELADYAEKLLKAANDTNDPAFKVVGVKKTNPNASADPIAAKVDEIVKRDNVSKFVAMSKAVVEAPELFNKEI